MPEDKDILNIDKEEGFSEWYTEVLKRAEIVDQRYPVKGMDILMPHGYAIHEKIMQLLEGMLNGTGHEKVLFPTLIPERQFKKEGEHIKGFEGEVFWVTHAGANKLEERLLLRPTSEVPMYYMFQLWIRSHADLPVKIYQTCTVFRYETKATRPLIRVREVAWNEAHTAHATWEEADAQVREVAWKCYRELIEGHLALPGLQLKRPEWDKFPGADYTTVMDTLMPDGRVLQIAGNHHLGQNFSKAFDIKFEREDGSKEYAYQTSYGVSTRLTSALLAIHGDKAGLVLPFEIAPIKVAVVPIFFKGEMEAVSKRCEEVAKTLNGRNIKTIVDARDKMPGEKFYYWEMKGVPIRLEVGPREVKEDRVTLVRRDTGEKLSVKGAELTDEVERLSKLMLDGMREKAKKGFDGRVRDAKDLKEVKDILGRGKGVARAAFCSVGMEGKDCNERLKEATGGGEVRGSLFPDPERPKRGASCVVCGKGAKAVVYIARAY